MQTVSRRSCYALFSKAGKFKICNQNNEKKTCKYSFFAKKLTEILIFYRAFNMDGEEEYSPSKIYYPDDVETFK